MKPRQLALIAASFVALFYAINFSIAKNVMPHYIKPFGFIMFRVTGAAVLFWLVGFNLELESGVNVQTAE